MSKPPTIKEQIDEPTIDWLIDEIAPNEGNSPLLDFNKKRLKALISNAEREAELRALTRAIEADDNSTGIYDHIAKRLQQLKEKQQ